MDSVCVSSLSALNNLLEYTANYDCALIDFDMPDVNGISVAQYLRTKTKAPVLLLSNVMESRELDSEAACSMHLFKPIKENVLLDALVSVLTGSDLLPHLGYTAASAVDGRDAWR